MTTTYPEWQKAIREAQKQEDEIRVGIINEQSRKESARQDSLAKYLKAALHHLGIVEAFPVCEKVAIDQYTFTIFDPHEIRDYKNDQRATFTLKIEYTEFADMEDSNAPCHVLHINNALDDAKAWRRDRAKLAEYLDMLDHSASIYRARINSPRVLLVAEPTVEERLLELLREITATSWASGNTNLT